MCEKFHYDQLRNERALKNRKSHNNNPKNNDNKKKKNIVRSNWGPVSGSNSLELQGEYLK